MRAARARTNLRIAADPKYEQQREKRRHRPLGEAHAREALVFVAHHLVCVLVGGRRVAEEERDEHEPTREQTDEHQRDGERHPAEIMNALKMDGCKIF